jgi:hypothetical protein
MTVYDAEKLQPQDLPTKTKEAWMQRDDKKYYLLNEKYTSLVDVAAHPIECVETIASR